MAPGDSDDEIKRLTELRNKYKRAENTGDVDGIMDTCSDDVVFIPPEAPPVNGADSVRGFFEEFLAAFDASIELSRESIRVEDEVAYEWGTVSGSATGPEGQTQSINNSYLIVYERGPDGTWNQSKHIWNSND